MNPIDEKLLDILVCPVCKSSVKIHKTNKDSIGLKCTRCKRIYPIQDGIPVMIESEAIIEDKI